jgi:uncharacterized protein (DUF305 family)
MPTSYTVLPLVLGATLMISACGNRNSSSDAGAQGQPSVESAALSLSDVEITFAQGMIAHHEQAIEMAEMALDPHTSAGAPVTELAKKISSTQDEEVTLMTGWLNDAGAPLTMDMSDGHDMSSMTGMMSVESMDALASMSGAEFDREWLDMMIEHHEGAIDQASTVLGTATNPDVIALAQDILEAQQTEIDQMRALLGG